MNLGRHSMLDSGSLAKDAVTLLECLGLTTDPLAQAWRQPPVNLGQRPRATKPIA